MSDWAYCPKCATPLPPDAAACPACGAATPSAPTTPSGAVPVTTDEDLARLEAQLDRALAPSYILVRRLGTGGMGSVFLARDPALKRLVAVKVLSPALAADPGARARFEREAQAVARLSHPNIVAIHAVGQLEDGTPYFVMQFVGGQSLAARLAEEGPFAPEEVQRIVGEVAAALAAAHAQGIIHRDIKPANVLYDDESGRVLVSDFGIAAVRPTGKQPAQTKLTMTGMAVGTPQYMSPEQLLAEEVTEKTDIYALGLLGYELLAGAGPFQATSPQELIAAHLRDTPKPLAEIREDVDPELERVIGSCLQKAPTERPRADEVAQRLLLGGDRLLEWPPPGLGTLQGALYPAAARIELGSVLIAIPFVAFLLLGPNLSSALTSFAALFLLLMGLAGAAVVFAGLWRVGKIARGAARALHSGFGAASIAETLVDRRGDTGALIAGTREYAALDAPARERLRRSRLIAGACVLAAAVLPVLMVVPYVWMASLAALVAPAAPWVLFVPSGVALLFARVSASRESRAAGPARKRLVRHREIRERDPSITASWNEAFSRARHGQRLGRGPAGRPWTSYALGAGLGGAVLAVVAALGPVALVGVLGPAFWQFMVPKFAQVTEEKLRIAEVARPYVLPPDSTITPLEAGRALYAMNLFGTDAPPESPNTQHPLPQRFVGWESIPLPADAFADSVTVLGEGPSDAQPLEWRGPASRWVLEYGWAGLDAEELRYLEQVAAHPVWQAFRTVARAPAMDYLGARFVLPYPDSADVWAMPIHRFSGTKELAYANTSRAAYYLARGRHDEAETALRETISVGFAIVDNGNILTDVLIGAVMVGIGRDGLTRFYRLTGRREAVTLKVSYDSVLGLVSELEDVRTVSQPSGAAELRRQVLHIARDPAQLRALRWEVLNVAALAPCSNVRELLYGPDVSVVGAFDRVRQDLVRFDSEAALLDLIRDMPNHTEFERSGLQAHQLFRGMAALGTVSGWVLGNPRIAGCTRWVTQGFGLVAAVQ